MVAQPIGQPSAATLQKMGIQCLEVGERGDRYEEVAPRVADEPLDLALVVALSPSAEPIREQVVRLQLAEHARPHAFAIAENAGHGDLGVVVEDRLRYAAEEVEGPHVAVTKGFRRLGRIANDEDRI